jgi:hypothetical protein
MNLFFDYGLYKIIEIFFSLLIFTLIVEKKNANHMTNKILKELFQFLFLVSILVN